MGAPRLHPGCRRPNLRAAVRAQVPLRAQVPVRAQIRTRAPAHVRAQIPAEAPAHVRVLAHRSCLGCARGSPTSAWPGWGQVSAAIGASRRGIGPPGIWSTSSRCGRSPAPLRDVATPPHPAISSTRSLTTRAADRASATAAPAADAITVPSKPAGGSCRSPARESLSGQRRSGAATRPSQIPTRLDLWRYAVVGLGALGGRLGALGGQRPARVSAECFADAGRYCCGTPQTREQPHAAAGAARVRWEERVMIEGTLIAESLRVGTVLRDLKLTVRKISRY